MSRIRPYCTFRVDGLLFGIDVLDVQEVIRHRMPTRVPTALPFVRGLINLRGQIVTLLDLGARLGLNPAGPLLDRPIDVIVRVPGGPVGLIVDELDNVLEFDEATLERTPDTIPEAMRRLISGLYSTADRSLLVLDVASVTK
jgi:purine-binding chemotaxis protein CheW